MPYASLREALATKRHASTLCRTERPLEVQLGRCPEERLVDFQKSDFDVSARKEILFLLLQLLGYGTPTTVTLATPSGATGRG